MPTAPATFLGVQPGAGHVPPCELWNLTEALPGHPKGSTVSRATLERLGYTVPPTDLRLPTSDSRLLTSVT